MAINTDSREGLSVHNQSLTFDLHQGKDGIGIGILFEKDRKPILDLRKDMGSIVLYDAFQSGSVSIFGATYTDKSRADYDFTISGETTWFRYSRSFGRWTPELRNDPTMRVQRALVLLTRTDHFQACPPDIRPFIRAVEGILTIKNKLGVCKTPKTLHNAY